MSSRMSSSLSPPSSPRGAMSPPAAGRAAAGGGHRRSRTDDIRGDLAAGWASDGDSDGGSSVDASEEEWGWRVRSRAVRPVPPFFPVDPRATRRVAMAERDSAEEVSLRISAACQKLSVHGRWKDRSPSAMLSSMEGVVMEVNIYLADAAAAPSQAPSPRDLLVEVQRRKGSSVAFHDYRRRLLDAAAGTVEPEADGPDRPLRSLGRPGPARPGLGRPRLARPRLARPGLAKPSLARPTLARPTPSASTGPPSTPRNPLKALRHAAGLLKKDRADARTVGMESLELLTDPRRAGTDTAGIACREVLFGSAADGGGNDDDDSVDSLFDEGAGLGIRETVLEVVAADAEPRGTIAADDDLLGIEREYTACHVGLCLAVLGNALDAVEEPGAPERFLDDVASTYGVDVLSSLVRILGRAKVNPHDACRAARCLGALLEGCGDAHRARARGDLDAARVVAAALEVGRRSHAKLEDAARAAMTALATDDKGGK